MRALNNPIERSIDHRDLVNQSSQESNISANIAILKPHEIDLAITLVAISLVFIICQSIKLIPDVYEIIVCDHFTIANGEESCSAPLVIDFMISLANLLCCINSAVNFMLYMLRGQKFRKAFRETYCFGFKRGRPLDGAAGVQVQLGNGNGFIRSPENGIRMLVLERPTVEQSRLEQRRVELLERMDPPRAELLQLKRNNSQSIILSNLSSQNNVSIGAMV